MHRFCSLALAAALLAPAAAVAQEVTTEGTLAIGAGGALQDGNRASFQEIYQHKKTGFGGIEEYRLTREDDDSVLTFDARLIAGDDDYKLAVRYEKTEKFYLDAGFEQFQVWYDGSGGYFAPRDLSLDVFDQDLSLKRGKLWLELGAYLQNGTLLKARASRSTRDGTKSSTHWGDTALVGAPYGTRNIVPTIYDIDEVTDVFTFDVSNDTQEDAKWGLGARYATTELDNARYTRRRPGEAADRKITTKDTSDNDIFTVHGYYLRKVNDKLTLSGGALRTTLDANISGSRIYGQTFDPVFDMTYAGRQFHDEGFHSLHGNADLKQTVLNFNAVYEPNKAWSIRPSVRFENLHQETMTEFVEFDVGNAPGFVMAAEPLIGEHDKKWDEFAGNVEVRYVGAPGWTLSGEALWVRGSGDLEEALIDEHTHEAMIDRRLDNERTSQKYSFNALWQVQPGLSFAGQYYFKVNVNDYDAVRDSTPPTGGDRYPAFITDQDFETHDFNVRMSWRPAANLSLVSRYDYQLSTIVSQEAGLAKEESSEYTSHIFSQSVTFSPTSRLYVTGSVNLTFDQLKTPAYQFTKHGDNNYLNGSIGAGYVVSNQDDVYLDYSFYKADNFIDNSYTSLPFGSDQRTNAAYLTWVRRQSETLVYTVKYGYVTNRDELFGDRRDFDAHVIYGRVQYKF